jgi:processive 1,2-diacylglycerol beta-glucosyltransferase
VAATVAAHPHTLEASAGAHRKTARFAEEPDWARTVVDRFELCNRHDFFSWVAKQELPVIASGDFHRPEHLPTWKTELPCAKDERAIVDYLRSPLPVTLVRIEPGAQAAAASQAA